MTELDEENGFFDHKPSEYELIRLATIHRNHQKEIEWLAEFERIHGPTVNMRQEITNKSFRPQPLAASVVTVSRPLSLRAKIQTTFPGIDEDLFELECLYGCKYTTHKASKVKALKELQEHFETSSACLRHREDPSVQIVRSRTTM